MERDFRVPHRAPTQDEVFNWFGEIKFAFVYQVGDLSFTKGALLFKDGKLYGISMKLEEPGKCNKLIELLRQSYGTPAKDEVPDWGRGGGSAHRITWYDAKNHNQVFLDYENIPIPALGQMIATCNISRSFR